MNRQIRPAVAAVLVLAACLALLFQQSLVRREVFSPADLLFSYYPWTYDAPYSTPSNATRSDEALFHQPLMMTHWQRLRSGDFPTWDPLTLAGAPAFFQGLNTGLVFSPLSLPFWVLPADLAVTLYAPLRLLCAGLFMWLFLRHVGMGTAAAVAGAVAYAFNGAFVVWLSAPMPTVALFLPLTLLLAERTVRLGRASEAAALALALGVQFTGAYLPTSLVVLAITGAYGVIWMPGTRWGRPALLLAGSFLGSLAIGAVALVPMMRNLIDSPAARRSMQDAYLPVRNLTTFALPDFWGSPVTHTWWHPGVGNYPEFVTYLGVSSVVLAGAGFAWYGGRLRDRRALFFGGLATFALLYMYGAPPAVWAASLPGLRQINPGRVNVALAMAVAALAAYGLSAVVRRSDSEVESHEGRPVPWLVGGAATAAALLALAVGTALAHHLPTIRALQLQEAMKLQLARASGLAGLTVALLALAAWRSPRPSRFARTLVRAAGPLLVVLVAIDLISAGQRFNPTLPPERVYPETPGLEYLAEHASGTRIAPVGDHRVFPQGHAWSTYGLQTVTGFDFHGDASYQRFLARASGQPEAPARWDYLEIPDASTLNLPLLGLLDVGFLVTAPVDASTAAGGFVNVGELTDGRRLRQTFVAEGAGLRRVDVLTATFDRQNEGSLDIALRDTESTEILASRRVEAGAVPNTDWLTLEFEPVMTSRGRSFSLDITAEGARAGGALTVWKSQSDGYANGDLEVDGEPASGDLWFRTFSTAPDRWEDAVQVYARDLNVYRNEHARGRAWFVQRLDHRPRAEHLDRLARSDFEAAHTALVDSATVATTTASDATVVGIDVSKPDTRRIWVEAPAGGFLVISERYDPGWQATIEGQPVTIARANDILMGLEVPPGAGEIVLNYQPRRWALSLAISFATTMLAFGLLMAGRTTDSTLGPR